MTAVLRLFWNICLLRDGPESVPTYTWFLVSLIALELAVGVAVLTVAYPNYPFALSLNLALINLAVTASIAWFALYLRNQEPRFPATLGAILGTEVVIDSVSTLALGVTSGIAQATTSWILGLWNIAVVGFILHRALATRLWIGILLSMATVALALVIAGALLGHMIIGESAS